MMNANLPTEIAQEPEEEASYPLVQNMSGSQNKDKMANINFVEDETSDTQITSSYKDGLSQPAECMPQRQRLLWLQKRRLQGLWAQCDDCNRWRYLPAVLDKHELPKNWNCVMNPDLTFASCSAPEIPLRIHDEEDLIYSEYAAGSLVVGRVAGWPWWPAMVDDCPDTERYYWLDGFSDIPTHYHVVFFDASDVTRAWLSSAQLKPYMNARKLLNTSKNKNFKLRIEAAITQANNAQKMTQTERLAKYSFLSRYKGTIAKPKQINKTDIEKYQKEFKRKFSVAFPNESSESEYEVDGNEPNKDVPKRGNVITIGSKKSKTNNENDVETILNSDNVAVNHSLVVQVDTNSDFVKATFSNDTSTTYAPDTTVQNDAADTVEVSPDDHACAMLICNDDSDF